MPGHVSPRFSWRSNPKGAHRVTAGLKAENGVTRGMHPRLLLNDGWSCKRLRRCRKWTATLLYWHELDQEKGVTRPPGSLQGAGARNDGVAASSPEKMGCGNCAKQQRPTNGSKEPAASTPRAQRSSSFASGFAWNIACERPCGANSSPPNNRRFTAAFCSLARRVERLDFPFGEEAAVPCGSFTLEAHGASAGALSLGTRSLASRKTISIPQGKPFSAAARLRTSGPSAPASNANGVM